MDRRNNAPCSTPATELPLIGSRYARITRQIILDQDSMSLLQFPIHEPRNPGQLNGIFHGFLVAG